MSSVALSLPTQYVRTPYRDLLVRAGVPDITVQAEAHRAKMLAHGRGAWKIFGGFLAVCRVTINALCIAFFISLALATAAFCYSAYQGLAGIIFGSSATMAHEALILCGWFLVAGIIIFGVLFLAFSSPRKKRATSFLSS